MLVYKKQFIIQYARYEHKSNETERVYCAVRTESSNTVQVDLRFKRLTSGCRRVCIQRVLRPRLSVVFFGPRTNAELVPKIHVHCSHPLLAKISLKIFAKMQPSKRDQNFVCVALQTQNVAQMLSSFPLLYTPFILPSSLFNIFLFTFLPAYL
jgi:hypothetical protein